jgi:hypothetical protein
MPGERCCMRRVHKVWSVNVRRPLHRPQGVISRGGCRHVREVRGRRPAIEAVHLWVGIRDRIGLEWEWGRTRESW